MDKNILRNCDLEKVKEAEVEAGVTNETLEFQLLPCQRKFRLLAEDEISLSSIMSAIMSKVLPTSEEYKNLSWDIKAKEMLNDKQAILFKETLYISSIKDGNCLLHEENKIFLERELEQCGKYTLNIEESYDGYVVFSHSDMKKVKKHASCGHHLTGKYDNNFSLIAEKRIEYDTIDRARVEKTLDARMKEYELIAKRETKINTDAQKFKAIVNMKGRREVFLFDGGIMLLMRYFIRNNFRGECTYYTMNVNGRILRCTLCVQTERKKLKIFSSIFNNVIVAVNKQYFNNILQDSSETYFLASGHMILHFWHGFNYIIHSVCAPAKPKEKIIPQLELMWKTDNLLNRMYEDMKTTSYERAFEYLTAHPNISDFLQDYVLTVLRYKPDNVFEFTIRFFQNMKRNY